MKVTLVSALLLASATVYADPIEVSVHGPIDPALVATSIASELARPVTQLPGSAACHAPCLAIAIDDAAATITFTHADRRHSASARSHYPPIARSGRRW